MTDDELKQLVGSMPVTGGLPAPDGFVGIPCWRFEEAGVEISEITSFVERHGGSMARTDPIRLRETNADTATTPGEEFFIVPKVFSSQAGS